jgi:sensor c-di-GMP phosphodiesterase-like protein
MLELGLEQELRGALAGEQLKLTYQPIAELHEGRIAALEALLRWEHSGLGLLQPGPFIGVAERSGLMEPIGR